MKKCAKCKIDKELSQFTKDKSRKDGLINNCRTCNSNICKKWYENNKERAKENNKEWYENNKERKSKYSALYCRTLGGKYASLKNSAKNRGLETQISFEQYVELIKDNKCYYCDASLVGTGGHSLNRINSNKGYLINNVKPCCPTCNYIMLDFNIEDLESRVYKIVNRMKKAEKENEES